MTEKHAREDDQATDPDLPGDTVMVDPCEEKAAGQRNEKRKDSAKKPGRDGIGIGIVERDDADGDRQENGGDEGVGEETGSLARATTGRLLMRDFSLIGHTQAKGYSRQLQVRAHFSYGFRAMCVLINRLDGPLRGIGF